MIGVKRLTCEICGSTELRKQEGIFVCQSCGCQYDAEEVKKLMVEGTVSVDKSGDAERFLDLARSAKVAGNNEKAEDYASQVLEIDTKNYEAWYIQGFAIGWQASIANDRGTEAFSCFNKMLDILTEKPIEEITEQDVELLKELKDHLEKITLARCDLYTNPFKTLPSDVNMGYINDYLTSIIMAYTVMLQTVKSKAEQLAEEAKSAGDPDRLTVSAENLEKIANAAQHSIGSIYFNGARKINACVVQAFLNWNERWEKQRIFDYFGTGERDESLEREAFSNCSLAYEHMLKVMENAIVTMMNDSVPEYIEYHNSLIGAANAVSGLLASLGDDSGGKLEETSLDKELFLFHSNRVMIAETELNHRTNRRYHNQYSTGHITDDGFLYTGTAKAAKRRQIEAYKRKRDEYDLAKKEAALKQDRVKRYWSTHPAESKSKKDNEAKIMALSSEIEELTKRKSSLGMLFKGKEKAAINDQIAAKRNEIKTIEEANKALDKACDAWAAKLSANAKKLKEAGVSEQSIVRFIESDKGDAIGYVTNEGGSETEHYFEGFDPFNL